MLFRHVDGPPVPEDLCMVFSRLDTPRAAVSKPWATGIHRTRPTMLRLHCCHVKSSTNDLQYRACRWLQSWQKQARPAQVKGVIWTTGLSPLLIQHLRISPKLWSCAPGYESCKLQPSWTLLSQDSSSDVAQESVKPVSARYKGTCRSLSISLPEVL